MRTHVDEIHKDNLNFKYKSEVSFNDINSELETISQKVDTEIKLAVKRATSYLAKELKKNDGKGYVNKETVLEMISDKIDKIELENLLEHKSNKTDMATNFKAIDIMHNQIKNISVTLLELITQLVNLESNVPDTENGIIIKKSQLLSNFKTIAKWIHRFNPTLWNIFDEWNGSDINLLSCTEVSNSTFDFDQ